jgi:alpha,alpha-trehalase
MSVLLAGAASVALAQETPRVPTPADIYGELFEQVQLNAVFPDSKAFVDALPNRPPEQVLKEYREQRARPGFDLERFVAERFSAPPNVAADFSTTSGQDVRKHIDALWKVLERKPDDQRPYTSRLPLPGRYIVPGGRFNEIYYWDSYFTMLGLEESGRHDLTMDMIANFAWLIDQYGHIPNGNRSYYLSRSQPPFFAAMIELAADKEGKGVYEKYLPQLEREYAFWMDGVATLSPGSAHRRVVKLADGSVLLGRSQYSSRGSVQRRHRHRAQCGLRRARGLSKLARGCGERMGFQLALARGRQDVSNHPHDRSAAARSEQPAVSTRAHDRQGLRYGR